jgi:hypothetical protein
MKVRIEHDWMRQRTNVFVYDEGRRALLAPDGETWLESREGRADDPPIVPTLSLPDYVLEHVVAAARDLRPASVEQGAALADSRQVRDRLLTLVERLTETST